MQIKYKCNYELLKGHKTDSGFDLRVIDLLNGEPWEEIRKEKFKVIDKHQTLKISTSLYLELPDNVEAIVRPKSSISSQGLLAHIGTVDEGYRGEVMVTLTNLKNRKDIIYENQKIAQIVFQEKTKTELIEVEEIHENTSRGKGGYGSTGKF